MTWIKTPDIILLINSGYWDASLYFKVIKELKNSETPRFKLGGVYYWRM